MSLARKKKSLKKGKDTNEKEGNPGFKCRKRIGSRFHQKGNQTPVFSNDFDVKKPGGQKDKNRLGKGGNKWGGCKFTEDKTFLPRKKGRQRARTN